MVKIIVVKIIVKIMEEIILQSCQYRKVIFQNISKNLVD